MLRYIDGSIFKLLLKYKNGNEWNSVKFQRKQKICIENHVMFDMTHKSKTYTYLYVRLINKLIDQRFIRKISKF